MISSFWEIAVEYADSAVNAVLAPTPPRKFRWLTVIWMLGLFVGGIIVFRYFFINGNFDFLYMDWAQITGPRLQFLQTAIREGQLPLHISDSETLHFATTRYLAVADAFISPQYILLKWLSLQDFTLVNIWFLYSLGFLGLLAIKYKLRLSLVAFTAPFLLFNFNGYIFAHYNVGHANWGGYFLFPWFVWLILRLLDGDHTWLWTTLMAGLLFFIWLQGSYHEFVWLLILLALIGIFIPRTFLTVLRTGVLTFFVSAFRLLPCILEYKDFKVPFLGGYPSLALLFQNLVDLPSNSFPHYFGNINLGISAGEWEYTCFIGVLGGIFLIYFGIFRGLIRVKAEFNRLLIPISLMGMLTLGPVFQVFRYLPIPLIQGERVSSRIVAVVLAFGLILGAQQFQKLIDGISKKTILLGGSVVGLITIGIELWQDLQIWRISQRLQDFWIYFNPNKWYPINNMSDTVYIWLVFGGLVISIVSLAALGWISWMEYRQKKLKTIEAKLTGTA